MRKAYTQAYSELRRYNRNNPTHAQMNTFKRAMLRKAGLEGTSQPVHAAITTFSSIGAGNMRECFPDTVNAMSIVRELRDSGFPTTKLDHSLTRQRCRETYTKGA